MKPKKQKAITISRYKGYPIVYTEGKFSAKKGKISIEPLDKEQSVKDRIDSFEKNEIQKQEEIKKQKEIEKLNKKISTKQYICLASEIKEFFIRSSQFVNEGELKFNKSGITITETDPANVCLIHRVIKYKKQKNIKATNEMCINVPISQIAAILKEIVFTPIEEITLFISLKDNKEKLLNLKSQKGSLCFPIFDPIERKTDIPVLKFFTSLTISSSKFYSLIHIASLIGESIRFSKNEKELILSTESESKGDTKWFIELSKDIKGSLCKSKYSIEYLSKIFFKKCKLKLEFANDYPLKISDQKGNSLILAPRIQ